jgi:hypothetical protein
MLSYSKHDIKYVSDQECVEKCDERMSGIICYSSLSSVTNREFFLSYMCFVRVNKEFWTKKNCFNQNGARIEEQRQLIINWRLNVTTVTQLE